MMNVDIKSVDDKTIVKPMMKRIDSATSGGFKNEFLNLLNRGGNNFILSLGEIDFIDSSGLGIIISIHKAINNKNGNLLLCQVQPQVMNLFNITRMNSVFKIFNTEKDALEFLKSGK